MGFPDCEPVRANYSSEFWLDEGVDVKRGHDFVE